MDPDAALSLCIAPLDTAASSMYLGPPLELMYHQVFVSEQLTAALHLYCLTWSSYKGIFGHTQIEGRGFPPPVGL